MHGKTAFKNKEQGTFCHLSKLCRQNNLRQKSGGTAVMKEFLKRKDICFSAKRYGIDAMSAMAQGLFASLLIGTIFQTIGKYSGLEIFNDIAAFAAAAAGAVIGVAVSFALKAPPLVMYTAGAVGAAGYAMGYNYSGDSSLAAGPLGAFLAVVVATELGKAVSKETKVDILVTPAVTVFSGVAVAKLLCPAVGWLMYYLAQFIGWTTSITPLIMGLIISVIVGIILTLPISSAAICAIIFSPAAIEVAGKNREGLLLAAGAATAGCCAQMVGFAVCSFRENRWGGLVAQGLGTSMLQIGNLNRKPVLWLPPTLASAVVGPLSTTVLRLENEGVAAGMGTCGMVGPLGVLNKMGWNEPFVWISLLLVCIVLPAVLSFAFSEIMRKIGWIKENDLKLEL